MAFNDAGEEWDSNRWFQSGRRSAAHSDADEAPMLGAPAEEKEVDPRRVEFRAARKAWYEENEPSKPMLRDYLGEEDFAAMMAFKNGYEGEGRWFQSDMLSD